MRWSVTHSGSCPAGKSPIPDVHWRGEWEGSGAELDVFKEYMQAVLTLQDGPIACPETSVNTNLRCVTSQKSEVLNPNHDCIVPP
jgi:hypothetical protein